MTLRILVNYDSAATDFLVENLPDATGERVIPQARFLMALPLEGGRENKKKKGWLEKRLKKRGWS